MHVEEGYAELEAKAKGGVAVVSVGECFVVTKYANREDDPLRDFTVLEGETMEHAKSYARVIKENGTSAIIELRNCGQSKVAGFTNQVIQVFSPF